MVENAAETFAVPPLRSAPRHCPDRATDSISFTSALLHTARLIRRPLDADNTVTHVDRSISVDRTRRDRWIDRSFVRSFSFTLSRRFRNPVSRSPPPLPTALVSKHLALEPFLSLLRNRGDGHSTPFPNRSNERFTRSFVEEGAARRTGLELQGTDVVSKASCVQRKVAKSST